MREVKSREQLALMRERPLDQPEWLAVMIDGVLNSNKHCVGIDLHIDSGGRKQVLDFKSGSSESRQTLCRLIERLKKRSKIYVSFWPSEMPSLHWR